MGNKLQSNSELKNFSQYIEMSLVQFARILRQSQSPGGLVSSSRLMSGGHDADSWKWWKKLFLFVAAPVIILGNLNAFVLADPSDMEPPPFVAYDHLRIRTKKFPWGDGNHSLIHNSHTNALPEGFEHGEGH